MIAMTDVVPTGLRLWGTTTSGEHHKLHVHVTSLSSGRAAVAADSTGAQRVP